MSQPDEEAADYVRQRLELRGEAIFLSKENREVSSWISNRGWRTLSIPGGGRGKERRFKYGRVKFLLAYGRWPLEIDHINRDRADDRLVNLREADRCLNTQNRSSPDRPLPRGVYKTKRGLGFNAIIRRDRQCFYLGYFRTVEEAVAALDNFKRRRGEV